MSSDEALRKEQKPNLQLNVALDAAKKFFGIEADQKASRVLESYDDANFYLKEQADSSGKSRKFVLKFHNGVESANAPYIDAQNTLMLHLQKSGFTVPVPTPTLKKKLHATVPLKTKKNAQINHAVRLLEWVEGRLLSEAEINPSILRKAGNYLGKLDSSLDQLGVVRGLVRSHLWDVANFNQVGNDEFVKSLAGESDKKQLLEGVLKDFATKVLPLVEEKKLRTGLVHGDFNDANIVLNTDGKEICGVIDFGDSVMTWRVNDPAIAMAYVIITVIKAKQGTVSGFGSCPPLDAAKCFLEGYLECYKLTQSELSVLPILIACRLATSGTLGWYSYSKDPSNEYLKFHAEPAWTSLALLRNSDQSTLFQGSSSPA